MFKRFFSLTAVLLISVFLFQNCATEGYNLAMQTGQDFESQNQYVKAYEHYKKALEEKPDDKDALAKLEELGNVIADNYTKEGKDLLSGGRYQDAKQALENALTYKKDYEPALTALSGLETAFAKIKEKYAYADELKSKNYWIEAVTVLEELSDMYKDDSGLPKKIDDFKNSGYQFYRDHGLAALKAARYTEASDYMQKAQGLKDSDEIRQDVVIVDNYLKADEYYKKALELSKTNKLEEAVNNLIEARKLVTEHEKVNLLFTVLLKNWSRILLLEGKRLMDNQDFQNAYEVFKKLYEQNPEFPEAEYYYTRTRNVLLKEHYVKMVYSFKKNDLPSVVDSGNKINLIQPGYLDSYELMNSVSLKAFNMFYQKGLHFISTGDYGKAILAFQSAEDQLGKTVISQNGIDKASNSIMDANHLKIAFWNFYIKNGESGVVSHASERLKESLKKEVSTVPLKNIKLQYDIITENEMSVRSDQENIDWGLIQSKDCNALLSGKIETLRIDTSRNSEWKTRVYKKNKIVDNKEYLAMVIKLAKLKNAQINSTPNIEIEGRVYEKKGYKKEIKTIETILPGISPKVEAVVEETSSYQVEKHVMKAFVQIDVNVYYQNGSPLWPSKSYQDEFVIEDSVISPDLQSTIPEEREGDPLVLPSEYEFMKLAVNHLIDTKIVPDLSAKFGDYGLRYYEAGNKLSPVGSLNQKGSVQFRNAIEEYYKFLACYKDKGDEDTKTEDVTHYLNSLISDEWILKRAK